MRAQAAAGGRVFAEHREKCHGANLHGTLTPTLAGPGILKPAEHDGWTLETVRYLVVNNFRFNSPASLTAAQHANVFASQLSDNRIRSTETLEGRDALRMICKIL